MKLMYTIAKNLCTDEFRRGKTVALPEDYDFAQVHEGPDILEKMIVDEALDNLSHEEKELLLLRYVNEESVSTMSDLYRCSRFSMYRKLKNALNKFRDSLEVK